MGHHSRLTSLLAHLSPPTSAPHPSPVAAAPAGGKLRVGMIGLGRKGTQWARAFALHPSCEVVACADSDADNLALFAERFGLEPSAVYDNYEEMLDRQQLDIVSPILPVQPNPEVVVRCARTPGLRAIACEKPIAAQLSEADDMVQACKQHGVHFAAGDACRNYAQINEARRLIDGGAIGDVKQIDLFESTAEISGGGCQGLSCGPPCRPATRSRCAENGSLCAGWFVSSHTILRSSP